MRGIAILGGMGVHTAPCLNRSALGRFFRRGLYRWLGLHLNPLYDRHSGKLRNRCFTSPLSRQRLRQQQRQPRRVMSKHCGWHDGVMTVVITRRPRHSDRAQVLPTRRRLRWRAATPFPVQCGSSFLETFPSFGPRRHVGAIAGPCSPTRRDFSHPWLHDLIRGLVVSS
jgi:hypothetical protein